MKQDLYKNMCDQICMEEEQKNRIWQNLKSKRHKKEQMTTMPKRFPIRAAVYAGILLMSGMTVFAASELSVMDRIADAMGYFTKNEQELTEEQKNVYAQYGIALDNEIAMTYGTLKLDAALYDENYLFVSFRYIYDQDITGYEELTAGTDIRKTSLWKAGKLAGYDEDMNLHKINCQIARDTRGINNRIMMYDPIVEADGVLSGSILLSVEMDEAFRKGDVIEVVRYEEKEEKMDEEAHSEFFLENPVNQREPEVLSEFSLEDPVAQRELIVDEEIHKLLENMGLTVEKMSISPMSLQYSGIRTHIDVTQITVEVVLKDGSIVEKSAFGSQFKYENTAAEKEYRAYDARELFAAPVLLEEIAGIRIRYKTKEVWIAAE